MPKIAPASSSKALHANGQKLTMNLFAFKKKDWGKERKDHIKKIKLGKSTKGVDMTYYFHKIDGSKHTKLFLLWLLEYWQNVLKMDNITLTGKVDCLLQQLVHSKAKPKVARSFESSDVRTTIPHGQFQILHAPRALGSRGSQGKSPSPLH